ncbi:HAD-IA family hydrolase [Paenibacillus glycinis]|uniref:HAD-IA family hydrolase n=1 Tax=Paenibacillus glycinis TaxID=2697035 RepID=A0ABW9XZA3_9BACL|nr:HAD-IA family hydrolase [Paenibacillus glycinis]NBD27566.1 HAD-IA family hydrolase [Paenibacillus glycinis]
MRDKVKAEFEQICRLIDQNEYISFDIYDTALLRNVLYPSDIFDIVEMTLSEQRIAIVEFKRLRIASESEARRRSVSEDITIDDIYRVVMERIGTALSEQALQLELEVERKFTVANRFIKQVYDYARERGKLILFISDMYLPPTVLTELLLKNGYDQYDALLVSGEDGCSKATGSRYRQLQDLYPSTMSWLHIGDNLVSDYENARKAGINAYYYKSVRERAGMSVIDNGRGRLTLRQSLMKALQINACETTDEYDYWERFGRLTVSSLFYGFTTWLMEGLRGQENVYFLSRDGYLPYLLYKRLALHRADVPQAQYIYASRRAYQIPNIIHIPQDEAIELLIANNKVPGHSITLQEIFDNLRLDKLKDYDNKFEMFGLSDFTYELRGQRDIHATRELLKSIYPDIMAHLKEEAELLRTYLQQQGIEGKHRVNVVDVGWRASTHKALHDMTGMNVYGYYLGTIENVYTDIADKVSAFVFNLGRPHQLRKHIMENVMMYEFLFSAPHGSLIGFKQDGRRVVPVLKDLEENSAVIAAMNGIQIGVLAMADEYEQYADYLQGMKVEEALSDFMAFIEAKRYEDLMAFSELTAVVGIGDSKSKQKYVSVIPSGVSQKIKRAAMRQSVTNLWPGAIVMTGSKEAAASRWRHVGNRLYIQFNGGRRKKLLGLMVKGIKDPKRAMRYVRGSIVDQIKSLIRKA